MKMIQHRYCFFVFMFLNVPCNIFSQKSDSTKVASHFGGSVTVTTKGISTIPNLTLGKPAALFTMSVGRKLSFDPEFRFALEGKPWTFIFWLHYEFLNTEKLKIRAGVNTALNFVTIPVTTDNFSDDIIWARRSLTGDLAPVYLLTKNISVGPYYMYIRNFEINTTINTHLLALRMGFSNIKLPKHFMMRINPQVYYLKMDAYKGYYFNAALTLANSKFPLAVSALINKALKTEIPIGEDFLWNVSLIYTFSDEYVRNNHSNLTE